MKPTMSSEMHRKMPPVFRACDLALYRAYDMIANELPPQHFVDRIASVLLSSDPTTSGPTSDFCSSSSSSTKPKTTTDEALNLIVQVQEQLCLAKPKEDYQIWFRASEAKRKALHEVFVDWEKSDARSPRNLKLRKLLIELKSVFSRAKELELGLFQTPKAKFTIPSEPSEFQRWTDDRIEKTFSRLGKIDAEAADELSTILETVLQRTSEEIFNNSIKRRRLEKRLEF